MIAKKKPTSERRGKVRDELAPVNGSKEKWGLEGHYIHVRTVLLVPAKSESVAIDFVEWVLNKFFSPVKTSYGVVDDPDEADTDTMSGDKTRFRRGTRGFKK